MSNDFSAIPLDELPPPTVVDQLDFEQIRQNIIDRLSGAQPLLFDQYKQPVFLEAELLTGKNGEKFFKIPADDLGALLYLDRESHPFVRWANVTAYLTMTQQQRFQQRSLRVFLQYAEESDLDALGALMNVRRKMVSSGDPNAIPPVEPVYEDDQRFRRRIQLKPESITTAGSRGSYLYYTLAADPTVKNAAIDRPTFTLSESAITITYDAGLNSPQFGDVVITVLSTIGDGSPDQALLDTVLLALNDERVRPTNDTPIVRAADIIEYSINVQLSIYDSPDAELVIAESTRRLKDYADQMHSIGSSIRLSKIDYAAGISGVENVTIISPTEDVIITNQQAGYCTDITVTQAHA